MISRLKWNIFFMLEWKANARKLALLDDFKRWNLSSGRKNERLAHKVILFHDLT
jgi:hypothetical protein